MEKIRKCSMEVHETESEIVRNIKGIILYKNYADFIHKLLGKKNIVADLSNVKNNLQSKDKDLVSIAKNVIKIFNFLLISKEIPVKTEEINNPDLLTALFFSLEGDIIHQIKERDDILKEKFNDKILYEKQIANLKEKIESDQKKLDILTNELDISKNIYMTDYYQEQINEANNFIFEISQELVNIQSSQNNIKLSKASSSLRKIFFASDKSFFISFSFLFIFSLSLAIKSIKKFFLHISLFCNTKVFKSV